MHKVSGVYAITDTAGQSPQQVVETCARWLKLGVRCLQFRDKNLAANDRYELALALTSLCEEAGALLIVNDDIQLVKQVAAHGVHLGKDDCSIEQARELLGDDAVIGVSCYNSITRAHVGQDAGADYVAFGAIYPSATKPQAERAGLPTIRLAKSVLDIPVVAIGGITAANAQPVVEAGVDALAVVSAVNKADNLEQEISQLNALFEAYGHPDRKRQSA